MTAIVRMHLRNGAVSLKCTRYHSLGQFLCQYNNKNNNNLFREALESRRNRPFVVGCCYSDVMLRAWATVFLLLAARTASSDSSSQLVGARAPALAGAL